MAAIWVGKHMMIGRTEDGMDIYAIPQQDPQNHIMLTTEMLPNMVFRNTKVPPVELSSSHFDELQLMESLGAGSPVGKSREQSIIAEVTGSLMRKEGVTKGAQAYKYAILHLVSEQLPGLYDFVYACADQEGKVYLAGRLAPDDWIPAGPVFTSWFQQLPIKPAQ